MKVLAFDPGGTTGWALADVDVSAWGEMLGDVQLSLLCGQIKVPSESENAWRMMELVGEHGPDVVVLEDFVVMPNGLHNPKRDWTSPMRLLAVIDFWWWMAQWGPVDVMDGREMRARMPLKVKQMPGEKDIITDELLKKWGLWRTQKRQGGGPHAMDALRHLIVFMRKGKVTV